MTTQTLPARARSRKLALKQILVPSDFSPGSDQAFKYALHFGEQFGAQLHVIHVLEAILSPLFASPPVVSTFSERELAAAEKKLRAWTESAIVAGVAARPLVRTGLAAHEIIEAAKDFDVDLVIIATHGFAGWKHFCIGSTAERVARMAPCPVLVVREKEYEFC